mgnify:CR=1 FL=1|jgi:predicted XRE-type DNA-binding protein
MKQIYKNYFQKSKVFLYPLLGIKKGVRFVPVETYITWSHDLIDSKDILVCAYAIKDATNNQEELEIKDQFNRFVKQHLEKNELYHSRHHTNELELIVFDLSYYKKDLQRFREGKYSEFSLITKRLIMEFFGNTGTIAEYMESYLYPEKYYEIYSDILNISIETLENVIELCDKPNLEKEDFKKSILELELFK